tara:strand:+ start:148 stop:399 length:252 start_codon:yes stop_codon:yes gene_type:complete
LAKDADAMKAWTKLLKFFNNIETVHGICPGCREEVVLLSLVQDYYRCTSCGEDTKQYINGHIKYLSVNSKDKEWLEKENPSSE